VTARDDEEGPEKGVKLTRSLQEFRDLKARVGELPPVTMEEKQDREHEKRVYDRADDMRVSDEARELLRTQELQLEIDELDLDEVILVGDEIADIDDLAMLVDGRIHEVGLTQLAAQWYQGKSLLAVSLAMAVANGHDEWLGQRISRHGPVVYVAAEATSVVRVAMKAWLKMHGGSLKHVAILTERFPLDFTVDAAADVMDEALAACREKKGWDDDPVLVVGDTQIDMVGNAEENSIELGRAIRRMRQWAVRQSLAFLLVHHAGHEGERGRGHSSQLAKADSLMFLSQNEDSDSDLHKLLNWQKVKGHQRPSDPDKLEIVPVPLPPGKDGAVIQLATASSLIAEAAKTDWELFRDIQRTVEELETAGDLAGKRPITDALRTSGRGRGNQRVHQAIREMANEGWLKVGPRKIGGVYPTYEVDREIPAEDPKPSWSDLAAADEVGVDPETGKGEERE